MTSASVPLPLLSVRRQQLLLLLLLLQLLLLQQLLLLLVRRGACWFGEPSCCRLAWLGVAFGWRLRLKSGVGLGLGVRLG